jgi:predicted transcriptional regulator
MQRTIELPEEQAHELERLAAQERRTVDELVQLALSDYLARRTSDRAHLVQRFREVVDRIQSHIPADIQPSDIEVDITTNFDEYLADKASEASARSDPSDAGRN